ncbi:hypothetical protein ACFFS0_18290, partial [Streptomyces coeruleoprunus]
QARFGRSWRRKAPVESLMPLRLAKYGVPLAETAPAGLAAAGIEPVLLPPNPQPVPEVVRDAAPAVPAAPVRRQVAPPAPVAPRAAHASEPQVVPPSMTTEPEEAGVPEVDYAEACQVYIAAYGAFPYPSHFATFLAETYGVTDPETGGPLPEARLGRLLAELRQELDLPEAETVPDLPQTVPDLTEAVPDRADEPHAAAQAPAAPAR